MTSLTGANQKRWRFSGTSDEEEQPLVVAVWARLLVLQQPLDDG